MEKKNEFFGLNMDVEFNLGMKLPSLIDQLKSILDQYPDDGQILKELVQNADDAGASVIKFLWDETEYPTDKIFQQRLQAKYQGPGLLAYNNARFSEDDWEGIRMISNSVKRGNPLKVGRFGLGFKSVFHMTDMACLVSCDGIAYIDPHEEIYRQNLNKGRPSSSFKWNMKKDSHLMQQYMDQWKPYFNPLFEFSKGDLDMGSYDSTLFRFPFRKCDSESQISDKIYSEEDMMSLIHSLQIEGHLYLLFLKNLETIEFHRKFKDGRVELIYRATSHSEGKDPNFFHEKNLSSVSSTNYRLDIKVEHMEQDGKTCQKLFAYWICQMADNSGEAGKMAQELKLIPLVGTAFPLMDASDVPVSKGGHLFCFLPLPLEERSPTGLNVHVNGYFALDQNRRHLKLPSADQNKVDSQLEWNTKVLIKTLLPRCLAESVTSFANNKDLKGKYLHKIFDMFPTESSTKDIWCNIVKPFYQAIRGKAVFPTRNFQEVLHYDVPLFCLPVDLQNKTHETFVLELLEEAGNKLVLVSKLILADLQKFLEVKLANQRIAAEAFAKLDKVKDFTDNQKTIILHYIWTAQDQELLTGLRLILTKDGTWQRFQTKKQQKLIYLDITENIMDKANLLRGCECKFVDNFNTNQCYSTCLQELAATGKVNLKLFDTNDFVHLFCESQANADSVLVSTSLPQDWYRILWTYLIKNFPTQLKVFCYKPIIPLRNDKQHVAVLSSTLPIMRIGKANEGWENILSSAGVAFVDVPDFVLHHPQINDFLLPPDNFLETIWRIHKSFNLSSVLSQCNHDSKIQWRRMLSQLSTNNKQNLSEIIRTLPIFETLPRSGMTLNSTFVSAKEVGLAVRGMSYLPAILPNKVIDLMDASSQNLAELLDLKELTQVEAIVDQILPKLNEEKYKKSEITSVVQFCLNNFQELNVHPQFQQLLGNVKFLPNQSGNHLRKPSDLFDPHKDDLVTLFGEMDVFPCNEFCSEISLGYLRSLRLRQSLKDVTWKEIEQIASEIDRNCQRPEVVSQATALVELLFKQHNYVAGIQMLVPKKLRWIPILKQKPDGYPNNFLWKTLDRYTASEDEVVDQCHAEICGSVVSISLTEKKLLNLRQPNLSEVVKHFKNAIEFFRKNEIKNNSNWRSLFWKIYNFLSQEPNLSKTDISVAGITEWVLIGDTFVAPEKLLLHSSLDLQPYFYTLPYDLQKFGGLFLKFGSIEHISVELLISLLKAVYSYQGGKPLNSKDLMVTKECWSHLVKLKKSKADFNCSEIYLPSAERTMMKVTDLCYNMDPWMHHEPGEVTFCHEDITATEAKALGIIPNSKKVLVDNSSAIGIPFGQKEKLVTRITRLLQGYPRNSGIMKELIQNADDAKASEIHFILDKRTHGSNKVFSEKWKPIQGPAFLVYNDQTFTQKDLEGIQSLGEGSKGQDRNSTGQYGVGFNSVYHLTDVPTLLTSVDSKLQLCVFDPLIKYADGADEEHPGRCYYAEKLKGKFLDVFRCFENIAPGVDPFSDGTLFRLPLRSHFSKLGGAISTREVENLLNVEEISQCLLFLKNVEKISFSIIHKTGTNENKFTVASSLTEQGAEDLRKFHKHVKLSFEQKVNDDLGLHNLTPKTIKYTMSMNVNSCAGVKSRKLNNSNWFLVQRFGFEGMSEIRTDLQSQWEEEHVNLSPIGGIAYEMSGARSTEKSNVFCFLPTTMTTDLCFHINGHFALNYETRDCLIDPKKNEMLSNWNDNLMSQIIASCAVELVKSLKVNLKVQEENFSDNIDQFLKLFPSLFDHESSVNLNELKTGFYKILYQKQCEILPMIERKNGKITSICWLPPSEDAIFDTLTYRDMEAPNYLVHQQLSEKKIAEEKMSDFQKRNILVQLGMKLLAPNKRMDQIRSNFEKLELTVGVLSPEIAVKCLVNNPGMTQLLPCQIHDTPIKDIQALSSLLKYILPYVDKESLSLDNLPLLLDHGNTLNFFGRKCLVMSKYANLFPGSKDDYLHPHLNKIFCNRWKEFKQLTLATIERHLNKEENLKDLKTHNLVMMKIDTDSKAFFGTEFIISWSWLSEIWNCVKELTEKEKGERYESWKENMKYYRRNRLSTFEFDAQQWLCTSLHSWALCPVQQDNQLYFAPLPKASVVLKKTMNSFPRLKSFLSEFPFLRPLDRDFIVPFAETLYGKDGQLKDLLDAVMVVMDMENWKKQGEMSLKNHSNAFMSFVAMGLEDEATIRIPPKVADFLQSLQVFESSRGHINLKDWKCILVPENLSKISLKYFFNRDLVAFLPYDNELKALFKALDVSTPSLVGLYTNEVLPHFCHLQEEARIIHLETIADFLYQNNTNRNQEILSFVQTLKTSAIFTTEENNFVAACEMFDANNVVFKEFRSNQLIPSRYYQKHKILDLMRKLDYQETFSSDHLLAFAKEIEEESRDESNIKILIQRSELLLNRISSAKEHLNVLKQLGNINCFPRFVSKLEHQIKGPGKFFCSAKESVMEANCEMVWSQRNVLSSTLELSSGVMKGLEIQCELNINDIVHHLQFVASKAVGWPKNDLESLCHEFSKVFEYISNIRQNKEVFKDLAFVPVSSDEDTWTFIEPSQVVRKLKSKLTLYPFVVSEKQLLDEISSRAFWSMSEELGCPNEFHPKVYANALGKLADKNLHCTLNVNDKKCALKAYNLLLMAIKEGEEEMIEFSNLLLLSKNGCMYPCSPEQMIFVDYTEADEDCVLEGIRKQIGLQIIDNYGCSLSISDQKQSLTRLYQKIQPAFLSKILVGQVKDPNFVKDTPIVEELKKKLRTRELFWGLKRTSRHLSNFKSKDDQDNWITSFINMAVQGVDNLNVTFTERNVQVLQKQQDYFFDDEHFLCYIDKNCTTLRWLLKEIARKIAARLHLKDKAMVEAILLCKPSDIEEELNCEKIPGLNCDDAHLHIVLGEKIDLSDEMLIDREPRHSFTVGDFVAIKSMDKEFFIYAKILGAVKPIPQNVFEKKYKLLQGKDEEVELGVLSIFSFKQGIDLGSEEDLDQVWNKIKFYLSSINNAEMVALFIARYLEKYDPEQYEKNSPESKKAEDITDFIKKMLQQIRLDIDVHQIAARTAGNMHRARKNYNHFERHREPVHHSDLIRARLFLRQARHDLDAIENDIGRSDCWACHKGHQAAEKAIKALNLSRDGATDYSHVLTISAARFGDQEITALTREIEDIVGYHSNLRYPDRTRTPEEKYDLDDAQRVQTFAKEIVERVEQHIRD